MSERVERLISLGQESFLRSQSKSWGVGGTSSLGWGKEVGVAMENRGESLMRGGFSSNHPIASPRRDRINSARDNSCISST